MEKAKVLTVATMPVNTQGKLTQDTKNALAKLIEQEFQNKDSLYHQIQKAEREKIMAAYHKKCGFHALRKKREELVKKIDQAQDDIEVLDKKFTEIGLNEDGEPRSSSKWVQGAFGSYQVTDYEAKELNETLNALEKNSPSETLKNKLLTRLHLAVSVGEANVIMREVLGNGLIPTITTLQIEQKSNK